MVEPSTGMDDPQLLLLSEIIAFDVFPHSSKTGENIKKWLLSALEKNKLTHEMVSGVTPDGASDGQCGLSLIATLCEKVDTCNLHQLQRGVLYSTAGLTFKYLGEGARSGNAATVATLQLASSQAGGANPEAFQHRQHARFRRARARSCHAQ